MLNKAQKSRLKTTKIEQDIIVQKTINYKTQLEAKQNKLLSQLKKYEETLNYYETEGILLSKAIIKTANSSFKHGEIDFFQYIQSIENGYEITLLYLKNLNNYNQTIIQLNNLTL